MNPQPNDDDLTPSERIFVAEANQVLNDLDTDCEGGAASQVQDEQPLQEVAPNEPGHSSTAQQEDTTEPLAHWQPHPDIPLDYKILNGNLTAAKLGHGAMGVVYKARQTKLDRVVALKMILAGSHAEDAELLARFQTEAEAIARLQHPNIVQVYEVNEHKGKPYFSLEFCGGGSLKEKLDGTPLPARAAAALVETLARAMQAVHKQQIVHRDLKPANVLLQEDGTPKITDFGLAKKLDEAGQTQSGAVLGTPSYMAPEQASGMTATISPLADVYALGAILYECLTGRPPFMAATADDTILQVVKSEPVPPSQLQLKTPLDLDTICLKCLQKDPDNRYVSAEALADDLALFQADRPIKARPVGQVTHVLRWCRRNRLVTGLTGAAITLLILATALLILATVSAGVAALTFRAKAETETAKANAETKARLVLEEQLYDNHIAVAEREITQNYDVGLASKLLEQCSEGLRGWEWYYLMRLRDGHRPALAGHKAGLWMAVFSPDGRRVATASIDGTVNVWDVASGRVLRTYTGHIIPLIGYIFPVTCLAFSPDGHSIASASFFPNSANKQKSLGIVKVWDAETGKDIHTFQKQTGVVLSLDFSPDGERIASSSINDENSFVVWKAKTGEIVQVIHGHTSQVHRLRYSPDRLLLASASTDGSVKLWNASTLQEIRTIAAHPAPVIDLAFAPDSTRFATAGEDGTVRVWETATGNAALTPTGDELKLRGHTGSALGVAFSPDGQRIASAGFDKTVRLWDAKTGKEKITLRGHRDMVWSVAFSPDGWQLLSASFDKEARIWDAAPLEEQKGPGLFTAEGHTDRVNSVAFSVDGHYLASGGWDYTVRLCDGQSGTALRTFEGHKGAVWSVAFSRDGKRLASGSWDRKVKIWDTATGQEILTLSGHTAPVQSVAFSPDGKRLVSGGFDGVVRIWDTATGKEIASCVGYSFPVVAVAFSPDNKHVASGGMDRMVRVWDAETGKELLTLKGHEGAVPCVAFNRDGNRLVSASWDRTVKVWNVELEKKSLSATARELMTFSGHNDRVHAVAFSPDGKRIASGGDDKSVIVWEAATGKEVMPPFIHHGVVWSVTFSPDGRRIATGCWSLSNWVKTWALDAKDNSKP